MHKNRCRRPGSRGVCASRRQAVGRHGQPPGRGGTDHEPIYPKTCTDLISVSGTISIVAGSGTGAYHRIRGSFPVTLTLNEVEASPCQPSPGAFRAQLITVAGSGTISF